MVLLVTGAFVMIHFHRVVGMKGAVGMKSSGFKKEWEEKGSQ